MFFLRRYARALVGSQALGDLIAKRACGAALSEPSDSLAPRLRLLRAVNSEARNAGCPLDWAPALLFALERLDARTCAEVLSLNTEACAQAIAGARKALMEARVVTLGASRIEALDLRRNLSSHGARVEALRPEAANLRALLKADEEALFVVDAGAVAEAGRTEILDALIEDAARRSIFVTAFPEKLLTGEAPEPVFVLGRPVREAAVQILAARSRALS